MVHLSKILFAVGVVTFIYMVVRMTMVRPDVILWDGEGFKLLVILIFVTAGAAELIFGRSRT